VATDWEAEVISLQTQNQEVRAWLLEAQSQQSRAEERAQEAEQRAKEAEELKAALAAKVAAVATAEEQLRQERAARRLSGSAPLSRGRRSRWRSGMPRFRGSTGT
jgi:peptidoglycan hydrolase CwlO-like protein